MFFLLNLSFKSLVNLSIKILLCSENPILEAKEPPFGYFSYKAGGRAITTLALFSFSSFSLFSASDSFGSSFLGIKLRSLFLSDYF